MVRLESWFEYNDTDSVPIFCFPRAVDDFDVNGISRVRVELPPGAISVRNSHSRESAFTSENPFQTSS